jgi:beta-phosphoglucomutase-like phosphatase (HAD superfamily)
MDAFRAALTEKVVQAVTPDFKAFVKALSGRGLKTVIATRANLETLKPALAEFDANLVSAYSEPSQTYGNCKWDAWRRAIRANDLHEMLTVAITGSGNGVRSALVAGMPVIAIIHDHVAYQDFGGADVVADGFSAKLADDVLRMLHIEV